MANVSDDDRAGLWFVRVVISICAVLLLGIVAYLVFDPPPPDVTPDSGSTSDQFGAGTGGTELGAASPDPSATATVVLDRAALAMGAVSSVEFRLERGGAPVWIDQFGSISLDSLHGQFALPSNAQATIDVTIDANLRSRLGAIAYGDEVWLSNPVTGNFETLPPGYDIDPSRFFDPTDGWRPLIEHLTDTTITDVGDTWYQVSGRAPAADVANVTVGLIRDQDVAIELRVDAGTALVTEARFTTRVDDAESTWDLTLDRYGATFDIQPPPAASESTAVTESTTTDGTDGGG